MKLSEAQLKILNDKNPRVVVVASAASGKALSHGSKLYTVNGPIFIENAKIGDKIYGEDGNLHQITGVFPQGKKKEYIVTFSDRTQIKCCNEHLWTFQTESLRSHKSSTWITASLQEIIDKYPLYKDARAKNNFGKGKSLRKNIFIPMTQPIQFPEQKLKIEPYTMGALLGDGSFRNNIFTNEDKDVLQWVNEGLLSIGASLKHIGRYDYQILTNHKHIFSDILKQYNLWQTNSETKFIPNEYKYNSINNRLLLLQGLIDTDGYCKGSSYDLVLKSKQLILDCKEVCESLGLTATLSEKRAICNNSAEGKKDCGIVYRLHIKTSKLFPKLHRSAKREKQWRPTSVYSHRAIISIEETNNEVEMTCITTDNPSKLFVTDNFIVTHNTALLTEKVRQVLRDGADPSKVAVITFTNLAAEELRQRLGDDYKEGMFMGTIHSLANYFLLSNGIDTNKYIKSERFDELFSLVNKNQECIGEIDFLLLDEAQDSSKLQFEFIFDMIKPKSFFVVGDPKQSIYGWNGGDPRLLIDLGRTEGVSVHSLNQNYRNAQNILLFAKDIINKTGLIDDSIPMRNSMGKVYQPELSLNSIARTIKQRGDFGNWAILGRTNNEVDSAKYVLMKWEIPCDSFKQGDLKQADLSKKMAEKTVKILTIHSAKGLEWDNVVVIGARFYSDEERNVSYVAATRARDTLVWTTKPRKRKPRTKITTWE